MSERKVKKMNDVPTDVGMELDTFEAWFILNWKKVVAGALILLAVIAVAASVYMIKLNADSVRAKTLAGAVSAEQILDALKKDSSGALACEARARLAKIYVQKKDLKNALVQYKFIASDPGANVFTRGRAMLDAGYIYELEGKYKEAISQFELASSNPSFVKEVASEGFYGAGRLYAVLKNNDKARRALNASIRQGQQYMWAALAQSRLSTLPAEAPAKKNSVLKVSSPKTVYAKPAAQKKNAPVKK